jgi:hypothetical protein
VELLQAKPHHVLFNPLSRVSLKNHRDVSHAGLSVTLIPDQRGRAVKTVRLFSIQIIYQNFIGEFLNKQAFSACHR